MQQRLEWSFEKVQLIKNLTMNTIESENTIIKSDNEKDLQDKLLDNIEDTNVLRPDQRTERNFLRHNMDSVLSMLDDRNKEVIQMRYGID
jgi:DNA-directed RNA polymerase sigma subunit (sigma70/sigma32)